MIKVCKFGGSSLSEVTQFQKVKQIVLSDPERKIVVVSAIGKRNKSDSKITDLLYILHAHLMYSVPCDEIWNTINSRFLEVKETLSLPYPIEKELSDLKKELNKNISLDYLISRGEYLTAKLMSSYLDYEFIDAKDIISFTFSGQIDYALTQKKFDELVLPNKQVIIPGFYGANPDNTIRLLSRGGSDITGAIIARCAKATIYENWTDVSGVLMADPRIINNPKPIKEITYTELRELSYMGANVLHEDTIFPVQDLNIPINILNTNEPNNSGTIITSSCMDNNQVITGIAGKTDFIAIEVYKPLMSNQIGFFRKLLTIFENYKVSIEHAPSGIDSISVVVSKSNIQKYLYDIISEIKRQLDCETKIVEDLALIAIVGRNMVDKSGISGKIFSVLGLKNISVKLITQGLQELNIIIGVNNKDYKDAVAAIYNNLVI